MSSVLYHYHTSLLVPTTMLLNQSNLTNEVTRYHNSFVIFHATVTYPLLNDFRRCFLRDLTWITFNASTQTQVCGSAQLRVDFSLKAVKLLPNVHVSTTRPSQTSVSGTAALAAVSLSQ
ncbi:hypothetical protein ABVT39_025523 [Epinephelus coioides]